MEAFLLNMTMEKPWLTADDFKPVNDRVERLKVLLLLLPQLLLPLPLYLRLLLLLLQQPLRHLPSSSQNVDCRPYLLYLSPLFALIVTPQFSVMARQQDQGAGRQSAPRGPCLSCRRYPGKGRHCRKCWCELCQLKGLAPDGRRRACSVSYSPQSKF